MMQTVLAFMNEDFLLAICPYRFKSFKEINGLIGKCSAEKCRGKYKMKKIGLFCNLLFCAVCIKKKFSPAKP